MAKTLRQAPLYTPASKQTPRRRTDRLFRYTCASLVGFFLSVLSCLASAQSGPPQLTGPASAAGNASDSQQRPLHIVRIIPKDGTSTSSASPTSSTSTPKLQYYGGPIISNPQVIVVYWGNNVSTVVTQNIPTFFSDLTGSSFVDALTEYSTTAPVVPVGGGTSSNQSICPSNGCTNRDPHGALVGAFAIIPSATGSTIDDTQIQAELLAQIAAGHLPAPTTDANGFDNTLYMIYFPSGITITQAGNASCSVFCGYHGTVTLNNHDVAYGVLPDMGSSSSCNSGCAPAGTDELGINTAVSSHEFAEAVTDTAVGLSQLSNQPPIAWYDQANGEVGDICNAQDTNATYNSHTYLVQAFWSNLLGACVVDPASFRFTPSTITTPAGTPISFTVAAVSSTANGVHLSLSNYTGTIHFTSSDSAAVLPSDYTFTVGSHFFSNAVTLNTPGQQTITVTDVHSGGFTASTTVTVTPVATHFLVTAPSSAVKGQNFNFTVKALDSSNQIVTSYSGSVQFTSTDSAGIVPTGNYTLASGVGTFQATLNTVGNQTITSTDLVQSSITGTSNTISVSPPPATHFRVDAPTTATAGSPFSIVVTALDSSNQTVSSYNGTVHISSTDLNAALPANGALANGSNTFSVTLNTAGNQTITATGTSDSLSGTSGTIVVSVSPTAGVAGFLVTTPASVQVGKPFQITVSAVDQFTNVVPTYSGMVHFTSTENFAALPVDSALSSGTANFTVTMYKVGSWSISVNDTVNTSVTGQSAVISPLVPVSSKFVYVTADYLTTDTAACPNGSLIGYTVDPNTGALTRMPTTFDSLGLAPDAVLGDPSGRFLYVADSYPAGGCAGPRAGGSVAAFAIDQNTGALTPIAGGTVDPHGSVPVWLAVDSSGSFLFVSNQWSDTTSLTNSNISVFSINQTTGALSFIASVLTAPGSYYVSIDPTSRFVFQTSNCITGANCAGGGPAGVQVFQFVPTNNVTPSLRFPDCRRNCRGIV